MLSPPHRMMGSGIVMVHPDVTRVALSMHVMCAWPTTVSPQQELSMWKNLGLRITTIEWMAVSWREVEGIWDLIPVTMRA